MDFVVIANAWDAGIANPTSKHHIARQLAAGGHRVLWVEGAGMRRPTFGSGADRTRMLRRLAAACRRPRTVETSGSGGVWVISPLLIPLPSIAMIRVLNSWFYETTARFWSRRMGFQAPILINYVPVLAGCLKRWTGRKVYHCVDRWDAFEMYDSSLMASADEACCRYADVVIASAGDLAERCAQRNRNTHLVMHGVQHANFARALDMTDRPADLPGGTIVGFFGLLSEWIDQDLLCCIAEGVPDCQVVLIGDADVAVERLRRHNNVHILGPRPFAVLPEYIAHFAVGIIPFAVNELTRAVNPVKLREMMAAGCPVVSTALPEVERFVRHAEASPGARTGVDIAHDCDGFVERIRSWIDQPASADERAAISRRVANETWEAKTTEILSAIESS